jgi:hypothetical protein
MPEPALFLLLVFFILTACAHSCSHKKKKNGLHMGASLALPGNIYLLLLHTRIEISTLPAYTDCYQVETP